MTVEQLRAAWRRETVTIGTKIRQGIALPVYILAFVLEVAAAIAEFAAAMIAGDR